MIQSNIFDYFFVLRPMLFFPGWSTLLAGYLISYKKQLFLPWNRIQGLDYTIIALLMAAFAMAMGASFLLNQLKDVKGDLKNQKLFIISKGYISKKATVIEIVILIVIALFLAAIINTNVLYLIIIFIILTGYLYNFAPFHLKDHPWGSLAANAAMGGLAFSLGWIVNQDFHSDLVYDILPYLLLNTALYLYTTLPDIKGDRQSRKMTLAVRYGEKKILLLSFFLFCGSVAAAVRIQDYQVLLVITLSFPFFIRTIIDFKISSAVHATKFTILFFAIMVCLKIPFYLLLMVVIFFATKWYFKHRFNYDYPNFKGR